MCRGSVKDVGTALKSDVESLIGDGGVQGQREGAKLSQGIANDRWRRVK